MKVQKLPSGIRLVGGKSRPRRFFRPCGASDTWLYEQPCPFVNHPKAVAVPGYLGWLTLPPTVSQYRDHLLIIPQACWPRDKVRMLGGGASIACVLGAARTLAGEDDFFLATNIGIHAAQSQAHPHWHFMKEPKLKEYVVGSSELRRAYERVNRLVMENETLRVFAGGASPGQCIVLPKRNAGRERVFLELPQVIEQLVILGAEKFRSDEGFSPDYSIYLGFVSGRFHAGCYTPRLNFPGAVECASQALWRYPSVGMQWTHSEIAELLRS